jgi:integrase
MKEKWPMQVPFSEEQYIAYARAVFRTRFPNGEFDHFSWDIRHLRPSQHKRTNARVYFTKYGSTTEPLPPRFAPIVKAYLLLEHASPGTMPLRADVARMLWRAIETRYCQLPESFAWSDLTEEDVLKTERQMLKSWSKGTTYKRCTMLQTMLDSLAAAPYGPIIRPIRVVFRTARQEDFERYTLEGQDLRSAKMPPEEAIYAIADMFGGLVTNSRDRLVICALAILLATGLRIGEVLTLPLNCEVSEGGGDARRSGLRYSKEKSRGGEKRFAVHWMTKRQAEVTRAAIDEVRRLTLPARERARVLEANPEIAPLPGISADELLSVEQVAQLIGSKPESVSTISLAKLHRYSIGQPNRPNCLYRACDIMAYLRSIRHPLWVVDRRDGTFQMLSESLFIQFHNVGHATKGMNPLLVEGLHQQAINDFLGGRVEKSRTIVKSAFERYNIRNAKGEFFSMHSHQFRHWVTTKAAQAGVPDHVIARWQGREHIGDLEAYKHLTPQERLETLKTALKSGRIRGQIAEMYFSLKEDVREVFLEGQLQAVHVTPFGLCVHDFKVTPCPKFLNCVKDCEDYVLDTANKKHINNLVQLQLRTQMTLDQALQQKAKREEDLSESWIDEARSTLKGVQRILEAAAVDQGTVLHPFKGGGSQFKAVEHNLA